MGNYTQTRILMYESVVCKKKNNNNIIILYLKKPYLPTGIYII